MIELVIKQYLDGHLDVPSFFEHKAHMPDTFVMVERTGGSERDQSRSATFAFQSYAPSMHKAAELNERVKQTVRDMASLDEVSGIHLNGDYNFTDTETKRYRYQAVFDINYF